MEPKTILIEQIIAYGVKLILDEVVDFIASIIKYNRSHHLTVSQLLSFKTIQSESVPMEVRKKIADYKYRLKCIISGIAAKVEEIKYKELDKSIGELSLMNTERQKVMAIYSSEKKVSLSFQTLSVVLELFTRANNILKERIEDPNGAPAFKEISFRLQNSILVFELLNFTINFIEKFRLQGHKEMTKVKSSVFEDIKSIEDRIKTEMENNLDKVSDITRMSVEEDISSYRQILRMMKSGWGKIDDEINRLYKSTEEYKSILDDLRMYRSSVGINIDVIALTAITRIVDKNVQLIKDMHHFKTDMLVSFTPFDYCRLIGKEM